MFGDEVFCYLSMRVTQWSTCSITTAVNVLTRPSTSYYQQWSRPICDGRTEDDFINGRNGINSRRVYA